MVLTLDARDVNCLLDALMHHEDELRKLVRADVTAELEARYYTCINLYDRIMFLKESAK